MLRKCLLFVSIFSLFSLATLTVLGFASRSTAPASAAVTPTTNDCRVRLTVNDPILNGTPASPQGARVTWSVANVPPCYRIEGFRVTFNFTLADGSSHQRIVNAAPTANMAGVALNLSTPLPRRDRPTVITATVVASAVPIDNRIVGTENATTELNP